MIKYWYADSIERQAADWDIIDYSQLHRLDDPALIGRAGTQYRYKNGRVHREDGTAMIYPNGNQFWYVNGKNITNEVNEWIKENNLPHWNEWTNDHKMLFKLTWC